MVPILQVLQQFLVMYPFADKIIHTGDTNTAIRFPAADTFTVETGGSERIRVDSSGRLLVGATASSGAGANLQVIGNNALQIHRGVSGTGAANINISKSRNATYGSFHCCARWRQFWNPSVQG